MNLRLLPGRARTRARSGDAAARGVVRAVMDIGSNSVRLVVYEAAGSVLTTMFNEKAMCALGRGVAETGRLNPEAADAALRAIVRYRALCDVMNAESIDAVATAALREAADRDSFIDAAARAGAPIRVLSGDDEAYYAAMGVMAGNRDAVGLVADLGGGSLELTCVEGQWRALPTAERASFTLGALSLMERAKTPDAARDLVAQELAPTTFAHLNKAGDLHLVGGAWRNIARMQMDRRGHPISILSAFAMSASDAIDISRFVAGLSVRSLENTPNVSRRRAEALPFAAAALESLVKATAPRRVVVSAFGVREGLLFDRCTDAERDTDPLLAGAARIAARAAWDPAFGDEAADWLLPVLAQTWPPTETRWPRLVRAAARLSDLAWRRPPDYRAQFALEEVLYATLQGLDHPERVALALTLFHRYGGSAKAARDLDAAHLVDEADLERARVVGAGLRMAAALSGRVFGVLGRISLETEADTVVLRAGRGRRALIGEGVEKRLAQFADELGLKPEVRFD